MAKKRVVKKVQKYKSTPVFGKDVDKGLTTSVSAQEKSKRVYNGRLNAVESFYESQIKRLKKQIDELKLYSDIAYKNGYSDAETKYNRKWWRII